MHGKPVWILVVDDTGTPLCLTARPSRLLAEFVAWGHPGRRSRTPEAPTLATFGPAFLDHRETVQGARAIVTDRSRWRVHVEGAPLARIPLRELRRSDIERWVDGLEGAPRTKRNALNLLRRALDRARREKLLPENPAIGVHVEGRESDVWTYLSQAEQAALITSTKIPEADRVAIAFAVGTGLRQGEQWALELRDLHVDDPDPFVTVRWGKRGKPTKTGRVRRVEIVPGHQSVCFASERQEKRGMK